MHSVDMPSVSCTRTRQGEHDFKVVISWRSSNFTRFYADEILRNWHNAPPTQDVSVSDLHFPSGWGARMKAYGQSSLVHLSSTFNKKLY
jgi:hypothetical protein